jgi:Ran GTPase-activating protein (RanGAP) involved in mRNA processing and transport
MENDAFAKFLQRDWFAQLRVLNLVHNRIGDQGALALAAHPAAKGLRVLEFGDNAFGKNGLAALAKPDAFPELTTLDLQSSLKQKPVAADLVVADLVAFLSALQMPRLRHLDLSGWPLGNTGAKVIAGSPAFAGLTRLKLSRCRIGDGGAKALFASRHLQQLVELWLDFNTIQTGADALTDPAVMPRLAECWLCGNKIPERVAAKLKGSGRYVLG